MRNRLNYIVPAFLFLFVAGCRQQQIHTLPSLNETYNRDDKKPFGGYIAYNQFRKLFDGRYIETTDVPFDTWWDDNRDYSSEEKYSLYVLITKNLSLTSTAAIAMTNFVKNGNDLFIAADYIDMQLQAQADFSAEREDEITRELHGYMHISSVKIIPF